MFFIWCLAFRVLRAILVSFSRIFLFWISLLRLPKPNVVYGHWLFFVYWGSSWELLLESSQIIFVLFQLFLGWNMFSLQALEICSLDLYGSFSFFSSPFFIRACPFHRCSYHTFTPYIPSVEPSRQLSLSEISFRASSPCLSHICYRPLRRPTETRFVRKY